MTVESPPFHPEPELSGRSRPTTEQQERLARRRRFNRVFVHLPVSIALILWLGLIVGMLWLSIAGDWFAMDTNQPYYRGLFSAVADVFTILMLSPLLVLCLIPPLLAGAFTVYRRRGKAAKEEQEPSLPLMWRVENIVISIRQAVSKAMDQVARPLITAHAMAAFVKTFLHELKQIILQEKKKYVDDR